jgi:hypothetical protein
MGQESLPVGSKDDHIATFFICSIQDFLWGIATRHENFGYKFSARRANLILCFFAKPL